jgi:hypothetical protein
MATVEEHADQDVEEAANTEPDTELEPDGEEEEPDEGEDDTEDAAEVTETEGAVSEKELERLTKALENEAKRHTRRVGEIMGDDAVALVACEACDDKIPGWHWPAEVYPEGSPERTLYELLAGGSNAQMRHPGRYVTCDECNGFGQVLTGARNEIHRLLICPYCKGDGYHDREAAQAPVVSLAAANTILGTTTTAFEVGVPQPPEVDFIGRPKGHPNYGIMSTYLTPEQQALDAQDGYGV